MATRRVARQIDPKAARLPYQAFDQFVGAVGTAGQAGGVIVEEMRKLKDEEGAVQDLKNNAEWDNLMASRQAELVRKQAADPLNYDAHRQWNAELMQEMQEQRYPWSSPMAEEKFNARRGHVLGGFNLSEEKRILNDKMGLATREADARTARLLKDGDYQGAIASEQSRMGIDRAPEEVAQQEAAIRKDCAYRNQSGWSLGGVFEGRCFS